MKKKDGFYCRQCGFHDAPDAKQLCGSCAQNAKAEAHARMVNQEARARHTERQEFAAMFGGNRHQRRFAKVRHRGTRHQ